MVSVEAPIAIITLNRPNVLNALRVQLLKEVSAALADMEADDTVRVVILTGAGDRAFAAGADISELNTLASASEGAAQSRSGQALTRQIERMSKPVIMAVNGFALGGGCEIAMAGDIIIASENAKFGQPEVNLGLIPGYGGTARTTRRVGKGYATFLCLSGDMIDAAEALRVGLIERVVPAGELMAAAKRLATTIASKAPLAVAACKRVINNGAGLPIDDALEL
ncbi:MAG TPA: enoyl-CoA hydratase-related protein, partial [Candidatus Cybelea sp.]|nr:enoyl-CoA hydratase-related protein [Candidatus Cybelea sp.]